MMYFTRPDQLIINPVGMIVLHSWETNSYVGMIVPHSWETNSYVDNQAIHWQYNNVHFFRYAAYNIHDMKFQRWNKNATEPFARHHMAWNSVKYTNVCYILNDLFVSFIILFSIHTSTISIALSIYIREIIQIKHCFTDS